MSSPFLLFNRYFSSSTSKMAIKRVVIIGGGLMGSGIAQVAAQTGHDVAVVDLNDQVLKKSQTNIETSIKRVAKKIYKVIKLIL